MQNSLENPLRSGSFTFSSSFLFGGSRLVTPSVESWFLNPHGLGGGSRAIKLVAPESQILPAFPGMLSGKYGTLFSMRVVPVFY